MLPVAVIGVHPASQLHHPRRQLVHHDLHAAFSGRNSLVADHGDFQRLSALSGRRPALADFFPAGRILTAGLLPGFISIRSTIFFHIPVHRIDPLLSLQSFLHQIEHEGKICIQIPDQEPLRVLADPVEPFHADFLHPFGSAFYRSRMEVKARSHAQHHAAEPSLMLCHPLFLFGSAKAHPDKVRLRRIDPLHRLPVLFLRDRKSVV